MGFKVDMRLVKSRKWKKIEKRIKNGKLVINEESSQLGKAVLRKLMTVDGFCQNCKQEVEFTEENINQNPINVFCDKCQQRYSYVMVIPEDGAWAI